MARGRLALYRGDPEAVREENLKNLIRIIVYTPLTVLVVWLCISFTTGFDPNISLQQFYIPALNKTLNNPNNTTLFFTLKLQNVDEEDGLYYEPINVTFFDGPNRTHCIGNYTIPKFYQGIQKTALKGGSVETSGLDVEAISVNGSAVFRVDLATSVRYKMIFWKSRKHNNIKVGANVQVNDQGAKVNPKNIEFSQATGIGVHRRKLRVVFLNVLVLVLVNLWY